MRSLACKKMAFFLGIFYLYAIPGYSQDSMPDQNILTKNTSAATGQDVFDRMNRNFKTLHCGNKSANTWLKTYSKNSNGFSNHLKNAMPLLDYVSSEVEKLNLPSEYALVPFIESHYNPAAKSKIGPTGLWQMVTNTAKHNGIKITARYDGRYSPIESTQAALNYLENLTKKFTDWQTTLMAYNAGSSKMRTSLKQQGLKSADAQEKTPAGLPAHTYAYVLKVKAIACMIAEPNRYGIKLPNDFQFTPLEAVVLGKQYLTLDDIAESFNIPMQELLALNPNYRNVKHNEHATGQILVPKK